MNELKIWVAFAETDAINDVALFYSAEGAKKWCDEMIKKYHGLDIIPEWRTGDSGGSIRWQPAQSFTYYLQEVNP